MNTHLEIDSLKVNHISVDGVRNILDIPRLTIEKGRTYGLVGESGAGKTVLAQTILGLLPTPPGEIASGRILLDETDLLRLRKKELRKVRGRRIAMIFQDPMSSLNPVYTVGYQLVQVITKNQGLAGKEALGVARKMIETVRLPDVDSLMQKYPHQLSGGQRQRIIIGLALSCGADLIIADEPTRNLDVTIQAGILRLLKDLQKDFGITILFIANNLGLVSPFCDEVGILYEGKIIEQGGVEEILGHPGQEYTQRLIRAVTPDDAKENPPPGTEASPSILQVRNLKKHFSVKSPRGGVRPTVKAVDGIDFSVNQGETLGIVGESGCGKSTLVNTLLLLHDPTDGEVVFNGESLFHLKKRDMNLARKNIQIVFQDPFWSLNPRLLVKDIVGEPLRVHCSFSEDEFMEAIASLLDMVGLREEDAYKYPHEFSGGQRQRIAIARALSVKPKMIVLDEPTSSIDVLSQSRILDLLSDLKTELGLTYIIISHDLGVVNHMSDKIIVMYLGKIVEQGRGRDIFRSPCHPYTEALFNAIPKVDTKEIADLAVLKGTVPSAIDIPPGCRFHPRCPEAMAICKTREPEERHFENRTVACHLFNEKETI